MKCADIEKVIKGLECCTKLGCHHGCEYKSYSPMTCRQELEKDALKLLKEQKAVEPEKFMDGLVQRYKCRKCGKHLLYASFAKDNYCSKCGQAVKWE